MKSILLTLAILCMTLQADGGEPLCSIEDFTKDFNLNKYDAQKVFEALMDGHEKGDLGWHSYQGVYVMDAKNCLVEKIESGRRGASDVTIVIFESFHETGHGGYGGNLWDGLYYCQKNAPDRSGRASIDKPISCANIVK